MRFSRFEDMLRHWAEDSPQSPALCYGNHTLSFSQLWEAVTARAEELRKEGKSCLGLLSDGSMDCVIELFAANLAGLQIVMLDENAPSVLLRQLIGYTDVDLLWGDVDLVEELSPALTKGVEDGEGRIIARYEGGHILEDDIYIIAHFSFDDPEIDSNYTTILYCNEY